MSWRRGQAYAQHLRDRVLAAVDRGMGAYEVAPLFQVSVSWIYKALARRRVSGESTARPQVNHVPPKLLAQHEAIRLKVKAEPDLTLAELQAWLRNEHQLSISVRGMWKTLRQLDLTRKKRPSMPRSRTVPTLPRRARTGAPGLARQSAEAEPRQTGLHRRNLGDDEHGTPLWPRATRRACDRQRATRTLDDLHLHRRPAP